MFNINQSVKKDYRPSDKEFTSGNISMLIPLIIGCVLTIKDFFLHLLSFVIKAKPEDIAKQLVLVTGGANGLGRALSMRFAREGCDIAVVDVDAKNAEKAAKEIREKFNVQCKAYWCDISDYAAIKQLRNTIEKEMKSVDILVNNAGLLYMADFKASDVNDIQRVVDVNLTAQIMVVHAFLSSMIAKRRGRIVSISSITALIPIPAGVVYSSTKSGLYTFMEALRIELMINNYDQFIKFTTVFPEFINTRRELIDTLDAMSFRLSKMSPERVADEVVKGVRNSKERILVTDFSGVPFLLRYFSDSGLKYFLRAGARLETIFKSNEET